MAGDWLAEVRHGWSVVSGVRRRPGAFTTYSLPVGPSGEVRLYLSNDGMRHLLVRYPAPAELPFHSGPALECSIRTLQFDGSPERLLDLACTKPSLFDVFDELIVSIVAAASQTGEAASAARETLSRWRELLRSRAERLPHRREMALLAELLVLEAVHPPNTHVDPSWWRGPLREPKDLIVGRAGWIEIKAAGETSETVTINGLEQLEELPGCLGYLTVLVLAEDLDGESVAKVARRLRHRMNPADRDLFDDRLLEAGWVPRHEERSWRPVEWIVVPSTSCPRLTTAVVVGGVPAGITSVRYDLSLDALRPRSTRTPKADLRAFGEAT